MGLEELIGFSLFSMHIASWEGNLEIDILFGNSGIPRGVELVPSVII